ncbi:hypothetical protein KRR39_05485 [Nocardioides panacis]|uniref:Uncharacterized protein n=1 Tax=Nocardioides panacis TaxID=2849501 RepID=A0A975T0H4_9ACTN|nr:hypothetical protein [Nocardioides panacis]QWZ09241.1 hypothetical protein KRR39_05485 [Nocardioides panacis]
MYVKRCASRGLIKARSFRWSGLPALHKWRTHGLEPTENRFDRTPAPATVGDHLTIGQVDDGPTILLEIVVPREQPRLLGSTRLVSFGRLVEAVKFDGQPSALANADDGKVQPVRLTTGTPHVVLHLDVIGIEAVHLVQDVVDEFQLIGGVSGSLRLMLDEEPAVGSRL